MTVLIVAVRHENWCDELTVPMSQVEIEIPFRCVKCDYDLRGIARDPATCPECGHVSSQALFLARVERKATLAAQAGVNTGLLLLPIMFFATLLVLPSSFFLKALPVAFFIILWLGELRAAMRGAGWTFGAWINLVELQFAVLATVAVCIACVFGCWAAAAYSFSVGATLPGSAPFRVPVTFVVAILGIALSLFIAYYVVLCVAFWPTRSYARMKKRSYARILCGE